MSLDTEIDFHISAKRSAGTRIFQSSLKCNVQHEGSPGLNSPLAVLTKIVMLAQDKAVILPQDNHAVILVCKELLSCYHTSIVNYCIVFLK